MKCLHQRLLFVCALLYLFGGCPAAEGIVDLPDSDIPIDGGLPIDTPGGLPVETPKIPSLELLGYSIIGETEIAFTFSAPVNILSLSFVPELETGSITEGSTVSVYLENSFMPGIHYIAVIEAQDSWENILHTEVSFAIPAPALQFIGFQVLSPTAIAFAFTTPVSLVSLAFEPGLAISSVEDGETVAVGLEEQLKPGQRILADLVVEDAFGQVFNGQIPLTIINERVPHLRINELRTEYSGTSRRAEFIEFTIISGGNLGGLRVFAASNRANPMIYEFQPVEVAAGEYVVLHLRTLEDECRDEYGDDLAESGGRDAAASARDFWIPGSTKLLRKTDAVYMLDQEGQVLDAVMIAETPGSTWSASHLADAAQLLHSQGAWQSPAGGLPSPADAVSSAEIRTALTRSISRIESADDTNTAADWFVTATGGATPGMPNSPMP